MPSNENPIVLKAKPKAKIKRLATDKESKAFPSGCDGKAKCCESSSSAIQKSNSGEMYTTEIQAMMYGFGDCSRPLLESAKLVEEIVHQQLNCLMVLASETAANRGAKFIGYEDLLFLMRKDKQKLKRMLKYLEIKDSRCSQIKSLPADEEDTLEFAGCADVKLTPSHAKRVRLCLDFLSSIDEFGEYASILEDEFVDEIKVSREIRRDRQTIPMDEAQYLEYSEARQSSFCRKYRTSKFKDWLLKDSVTGFKPTAFAMELLNYLAYEIVAQLVDLALMIKQDREPDPFLRFQPLSACNTDYSNTQAVICGSKSVSVPESPTQGSPPPSPTAQSGSLVHPSTSSQTSVSPKPKPKKAKKGPGKASYDFLSYNAIQPEHIREVISRYWKESGPFLLFSKCHRSNLRNRLLCC